MRLVILMVGLALAASYVNGAEPATKIAPPTREGDISPGEVVEIKRAVQAFEKCIAKYSANHFAKIYEKPELDYCGVPGYYVNSVNDALKCPRKKEYVPNSRTHFPNSAFRESGMYRDYFYDTCDSKNTISLISLIKKKDEWIFAGAGLLVR